MRFSCQTTGSDTERFSVCRAFSLIEMLIVIAVLALLTGLASLAFDQISLSMKLDQAGRMILDEISLARHGAATRNENVELRFIKAPTSADPYFSKIQSGVYDPGSGTPAFRPIRAPAILPPGVRLTTSGDLSPMLTSISSKTNSSPAYDYVPITIRPNGEIDPINAFPRGNRKKWCITLVSERMAGTSNVNDLNDFITIQIDPVTSRAKAYRP